MAARDVGCDRRGELARGSFGPPACRLVRRTKGWADERQRRADALGRARKVGFACARAPACLVWADTSGDLAISSVVRVVERGRIMGDRIPNQLSCSPSLMHRSLDTQVESDLKHKVGLIAKRFQDFSAGKTPGDLASLVPVAHLREGDLLAWPTCTPQVPRDARQRCCCTWQADLRDGAGRARGRPLLS